MSNWNETIQFEGHEECLNGDYVFHLKTKQQVAKVNNKKWDFEGHVDCPVHIKCNSLIKGSRCDECRYDSLFKGKFQAANINN